MNNFEYRPILWTNTQLYIEVKEVRRKVSDEAETKGSVRSIYGTAEEMMERAKEE